MTLHLVRLPIDLRALSAFAVANRASDDDSGYALHLALRGRFGTAGPQPFRFLPEHRTGPHLLGYTSDPDALTDTAALPATDPLLADVFAAPKIQKMPIQWRTGARYRFEVRVRPVVRFGNRVKGERAASEVAQKKENWWARAGEVDAWIAARTNPNGDPAITREAAYIAWLGMRLSMAATLESVEVAQFRRVDARRSTHGRPGRGKVEGPEAILTGTLTVTDPVAFAHALARGVGRHAAFGYGMLLLSPPGRAG